MPIDDFELELFELLFEQFKVSIWVDSLVDNLLKSLVDDIFWKMGKRDELTVRFGELRKEIIGLVIRFN